MSFPIYQISVTRNGGVLTIADPPQSIPPDAVLQWIVTGVQRDEVVEVLAKGPPAGDLGPFTFSRRSQGVIWARGHSGYSGDFEYSLSIFKLGTDRSSSEKVAESGWSTLRVENAGLRAGETILVEYDELLDQLVVDQRYTRMINGDPLLFEFRLPKDLFNGTWIPSIFFPAVASSRGYGPFSSLSVVDGPRFKAGGDEEKLIRRFLVATGASGLLGQFQYQAVIHSADGGELVSSPDPVIDNDGEVICPGC
jgi:hypothetical protein